MKEHVVESSKIVLDLNDKIHVLHVDDDSGLLKITKQCLEMEGPLQVDTALSVEEALMKLEKDEYDIVVSDYQMPGKDGLDFLKALRSRGNAIPFIMFTGKGREEVAIEALNLGANQYLNKMGETETVYVELAHSITELAKTRKAEEKQRESEERFRDLFENANDGLVFVDLSGRIVDLNQKATEIAEKRKEDIVGKSFLDLGLVSLNDVPVLVEKLGQQAMGKPTERFEFEIESEKGEKKLIEISSTVIRKNNMPTGSLAIVRDITERKKAEEALRESEERFSTISAATFEGIGISEQAKIIDANYQLEKMLGYEPGELIGKSVLDFVAPESRDLVMARIRAGYEGPCEHLAMRKDGSVFPVEIRAKSLPYKGIMARVTAIRDITGRKKAEEALCILEERYRNLFENSKELMVTYDLKGNLTALNKVAIEYDVARAQNIGRNMLEFVPEEQWPRIREEAEQILQGKCVESEIEIDTPKGKRMFEYRSSPIREGEKIVGIHGSYRDITEHKKTEETLRLALEKHTHDLVERVKELRCVYGLSKLVETSGITLDSILQGTTNLLPDAWQYPEITGARIVLEGQEFVTSKFGGETRWRQQSEINVHGRRAGFVEVCYLEKRPDVAEGPFLNEERMLINAVAERLGRITERVRTEECLKSSNERLRIMFENAPDAYYISDLEGHFIDGNKAAEEMTGYRKDELVGKSFLQLGLLPKEQIPKADRLLTLNSLCKSTGPDDFVLNRKNGTQVVAEIRTIPAKIDGKTVVLGIARDVTQRMKIQNTMAENQAQFKALFVDSPEAEVFLDKDFRIVDINPRFEELFGYSLAEIKGKHLIDVIVQMDKMEEAETLDRKASDGYIYHNTVRRRKDGALVPVAVSAAPIKSEGTVVGYVGVYKDISELRNTQQKLETMNEKLRVVGGLTRHDVRNKLSTITGNLYLNRKKLVDYPDVLESFKDMESACKQIVGIFEFARDYERLGVEELASIDVGATVNKAVGSFSDLKGVRIVNECHGLTVLADSLLERFFYNLIDNSLKYGEKLTQIRIHHEKSEDQLKLVYEDDGIGISKDVKAKLFTEGFTMGKGSGYGLYLIKRMMEVYGWTISETGMHSKGAQFTVTIPETNRDGKENYKLS
jgi:PAS domain S-box-containing protein